MSLVAFCIDSPQASTLVVEPLVQLSGWIVTDRPVRSIQASELDLDLALQPRPDVQALYPNQQAVGFCSYIDVRALPEHVRLHLKAWEDNDSHIISLTFSRTSRAIEPLFFYNCDSPHSQALEHSSNLVAGWIAYSPASKIEHIHLEWDNAEAAPINLNELINRPDVENAFPGLKAIGFNGLLSVFPFLDNTDLDCPLHARLCFDLDGVKQERPITFTFSQKWQQLVQQIRQHQPAKLARLRPLLQCPICQNPDLRNVIAKGSPTLQEERSLECNHCNAQFPSVKNYNFLSQELREQGAVEDTDNVSSLPYAATALHLIESLPDGLILDNGAGFRDHYYSNVVNFEIAAYPTTDVLGIGERLPFREGVFDAVLSSLVLEHVRDPFQCAAEIARVLKPGGKLYCAAPLMQPFHGYPNHYYNATLSGLHNLFESHLEIIDSGVCPEDYGQPVWALCWMLHSYVRGLPSHLAEEFKQLKVSDFLLADPTPLLSKDFVLQLAEETKRELACTNFLIAVKR